MFTNEGSTDRVIRVIAGMGLLALYFFGPQTPWGLLGIVPLLTGVVGMCPLYSVFGWSTCAVKPAA